MTLNDEDHVEDLLLDYQPTERSVRTAMIFGLGFWKSAGLMALIFGGGIALTQVMSVDWTSQSSIAIWLLSHALIGLSFGLAMYSLFRLLLIPLWSRNTFRKNRTLLGPSTLRANKDGLTFSTPKSLAVFGWSDLRSYKVFKGALVFQIGAAHFAVPTEQFPAEDLEALHRLIERHLSKSA